MLLNAKSALKVHLHFYNYNILVVFIFSFLLTFFSNQQMPFHFIKMDSAADSLIIGFSQAPRSILVIMPSFLPCRM